MTCLFSGRAKRGGGHKMHLEEHSEQSIHRESPDRDRTAEKPQTSAHSRTEGFHSRFSFHL